MRFTSEAQLFEQITDEHRRFLGVLASIPEARRRESGARVMRKFECSYQQVLGLAARLSPAELLVPGRVGWTGKYPLTTYLAPNTCNHYRFATRILKRWLRTNSVTGRRRAIASGRHRA